MPTYEYACSKCGEHLEVVQSFTDDPLKKCPACGGRLKKVFGAVGIVFKGSGFYKTDSRNASKAAKVTAGTDKAAGSDKASSDSGSSAESSSPSEKTGSDKAKTDTKKDPVSSSKTSGSSAAPAAAS